MPLFITYLPGAGTSTARPLGRWFDAPDAAAAAATPIPTDETLAPYGAAVEAAILSDPSPDLDDWTYNPQAGAVTGTVASDLPARQAMVLAQIEGLIGEVEWTQALDAQITGPERRRARAYIAALRAASASVAGSSNPEAVALPTLSPATFTLTTTDQGEVLERGLNSGNFIDNSRFEDLLPGTTAPRGWQEVGVGAVGVGTGLLQRAAGATWSGSRYPTGQLAQLTAAINGTTDFSQATARNINKDGSLSNMLMPVAPGDWVEFGVQISTHRCTGQIGLQWYDAGGAPVPAVAAGVIPPLVAPAAVPTVASSQTNPDDWPRYWTMAQVPAGVAYAGAAIRKFGTIAPGTDSLLVWHKPMLCFAHERQAQPSAYQPESPRFQSRAQAQDNMATDVWEAGRVGYVGAGSPEYNAGMDAVNFSVGNLPETDQFVVTMTARARSQGTGNTTIFFQYQVRQDGGAFGAWVNLRIWQTGSELPLQSAYVPLAHAGIITGEFDEIRLRVRFGSGAGTTNDIIGRVKVKVRRGVL